MRSKSVSCRCPVCRDEAEWSGQPLARWFRHTRGEIAERGWSVTTHTYGGSPVGYTLGLWHSYRFPEIAIFGLGKAESTEVLELVATGAAASREPAPADQLIDRVEMPGAGLRLRQVDPSWTWSVLVLARQFYSDTPEVPFLQLNWADNDGRFPGDEGFDERLADLQPMMWLAADEHPEGRWTEID
ncbi:DUF4262 domain-containing protein [Amycolatopsis minnesotensis]|uniref:DUF4262 domain-containing protein n=1 Tax=Amycolatopsis minnesotensis TaxID=337894 RepID=UPI0031E2C52D